MNSTENEILNLMIAGRKAEAVTLYQKFASVGLAEAKEYVENLTEEKKQAPLTADLDGQLLDLCRQNSKVLAVKLFAETKNVDIANAYNHVNQLLQKHNMLPVPTKQERFLPQFFKFIYQHMIVDGLLRPIWAFVTGDQTKLNR